MKIQIPKEVTQEFNNQRTEESFKKIWDISFIPMRKYCNSIINDWRESEDVTLRAFLKLWFYKKEFNDSRHLANSLIAIVRNESLNFNKAKQARLKKESSELLDFDIPDEGLEYSTMLEEQISKVYSFLKTLPARCRLTMELRLQGKECKEVSKILGVSVDTVTTQYSRAIAKLRKYLKNE